MLHRLLRCSWGHLPSKVSIALLVLFKRRSKEMDSIATILAVTADVVEELRLQANRGRPREDHRLVAIVMQRRRVFRMRRPLPYSGPGRAEVPTHMGQAPGQAEDPSEVRIFLAEEEARTLYQLRVRAFSHVSGDSSTSVADVVMELSNLRHNNMIFYEARYPAAVEVRNNLGDEIWDRLEDYRCGVAYLAFSTLQKQRTASIDFPAGLREFLDQYIPHMETYINARFGENDMDLFQCCHEDLYDLIGREREQGIEAQEAIARPMQFIKKLFRRQPIFWLAFNLYFPVEERMSWEQVSMWAIQWLRGTNIEPPAWPIELRGLYVWNPDTTSIWNGAVLELFADMRRRFRSTHTFH